MRGEERQQRSMLMVMDVEQRIPQEHPLRRIKQITGRVLKNLSPIFDQMYSRVGRPSVPPERLLKASLLMALYTIRSERLFCEQLDYNLLFRWFLDLELDEQSFDHSSFTSNRQRLLEHEVAGEFFRGVLEHARTIPIGRRLIRRPCWRARVRVKRPSFATRPMPWRKTATACWSTCR